MTKWLKVNVKKISWCHLFECLVQFWQISHTFFFLKVTSLCQIKQVLYFSCIHVLVKSECMPLAVGFYYTHTSKKCLKIDQFAVEFYSTCKKYPVIDQFGVWFYSICKKCPKINQIGVWFLPMYMVGIPADQNSPKWRSTGNIWTLAYWISDSWPLMAIYFLLLNYWLFSVQFSYDI